MQCMLSAYSLRVRVRIRVRVRVWVRVSVRVVLGVAARRCFAMHAIGVLVEGQG